MIDARRLEDWERASLQFNPFEGDRDVNVRLIRDGFLVTRSPHKCSVCVETVPAHNVARARTEACDGQLGTFYFCLECCHAMGAVIKDGNDCAAIEARYEIGYRNCR